MYTRPGQMSPFYPSDVLSDLAIELIEKSSGLDGAIAPQTARALEELMLHTNSYYSNLIEGQHTRPLAVEANVKTQAKSKSDLVTLGAAHIKTEKASRQWVDAGDNPFRTEFVLRLHREFYSLLPESMRQVKYKNEMLVVNAGEWRKRNVEVGDHVAASHEAIPHLMEEFVNLYKPNNSNKAVNLLRVVAGHHRFEWIHPFLDGNGRVGRLLTHTWLRAAGIMGSGLWSISRGLARNREAYLNSLQDADKTRQGNYDGRGNLSQKALDGFCRFMLTTAIDQVEFMRSNFQFDFLDQRLKRAFEEFAISIPGIRKEGWLLAKTAIVMGHFERGEAERISGLGERVSRDLLTSMIEHSLLASDSLKGRKVYASFPVRAVSWYFPELFPPGDVLEYGKQLQIDDTQKSARRIPVRP